MNRTKIEFYNDTASGYASKENLYFMFFDVPKILLSVIRISYFPFCSRHGKSDCDRHFQKVKLWCSHFEHHNELASPENVSDAILNGSRNSNISRTLRNKYPIQCIVFHCQITEPTRRKHVLDFPEMRSSNAITWERETNHIINHVLPENPLTNRPPITKVKLSDYPAGLLSDPYKSFVEEQEPSLKVIQGRVKQRKKWVRQYEKWSRRKREIVGTV